MVFRARSSQVSKCCKGQQSGYGLNAQVSACVLNRAALLLLYESMRFCDRCARPGAAVPTAQ